MCSKGTGRDQGEGGGGGRAKKSLLHFLNGKAMIKSRLKSVRTLINSLRKVI